MAPPRNIAFILEEFGADTPAQHLLDRFLIGYPRDGEFHRPDDWQVHVWLALGVPDQELFRRTQDFPLERHQTVESAAAAADAIVFVPRQIAAPELLESVLQSAAKDSPVFAHGALAETAEEASRLAAQAAERNILLAAGTPLSVTWRLPEIAPPAAALTDAVIVAQGPFPLAELHALDGLLPLLERRTGGDRAVRRVQHFKGARLWGLVDGPRRRLLAAALSCSDSPQGDPVRDGRTQDLLGLNLLPKLAANPRAWQIDHADGLRSTIFVLDGVVADFNLAIKRTDGSLLYAQLFRPPPPQRHEFSRLAATIEQFFRERRPPWSPDRALLTSKLLGMFAAAQ